MDEFDALLLQLKQLGNMDFSVSRSPPTSVLQQQTVPYFPPVTSALRHELRRFSCQQSACVEYGDDEALPSPQFIPQVALLHQQHAIVSKVDCGSTFHGLSESFVNCICSQSCPDVKQISSKLWPDGSDQSSNPHASVSVSNQHLYSALPSTACFNG